MTIILYAIGAICVFYAGVIAGANKPEAVHRFKKKLGSFFMGFVRTVIAICAIVGAGVMVYFKFIA